MTPDPAVATPRRSIQTVAARVPDSFAQKQEMRHRIRALFIELGPAALWLTPIGPARSWLKAAAVSPAAIAAFCHKTCTSTLEASVSPGDGKTGIFGELSTYSGVVETMSREPRLLRPQGEDGQRTCACR
ncbi:hypothetical protein DM02DRAFT_654770 [Periconia macrospinosa]|uniref:Uncharacterized protein n=1 Tax=Periconia macrospinosa TaxID=97972 RepID=A0A2V1DV11_9PLEO|nr:hypothetical protein DM02DRAFT_654770 [Periconia macrospinosa]